MGGDYEEVNEEKSQMGKEPRTRRRGFVEGEVALDKGWSDGAFVFSYFNNFFDLVEACIGEDHLGGVPFKVFEISFWLLERSDIMMCFFSLNFHVGEILMKLIFGEMKNSELV